MIAVKIPHSTLEKADRLLTQVIAEHKAALPSLAWQSEESLPDFFSAAERGISDLFANGTSTPENLHALRKVIVNICLAAQKLDELQGTPGFSGDETQELMLIDHLISKAIGPKAL